MLIRTEDNKIVDAVIIVDTYGNLVSNIGDTADLSTVYLLRGKNG